jgi:hypothetical protein
MKPASTRAARPLKPADYLKKILTARVYDVAVESALEPAKNLSRRLHNRILLKREDQQPVFSFKLRGAYNKMAHLPPEQLKKGVICASAGNHAQGVALGAHKLGCRAVIVMPTTTPHLKVDAVRALGGEVVLFGDSYSDAYAHSLELEKKEGLTFVHPFDDPDVIAGQGTVAMEMPRQVQTLGGQSGARLDARVCRDWRRRVGVRRGQLHQGGGSPHPRHRRADERFGRHDPLGGGQETRDARRCGSVLRRYGRQAGGRRDLPRGPRAGGRIHDRGHRRCMRGHQGHLRRHAQHRRAGRCAGGGGDQAVRGHAQDQRRNLRRHPVRRQHELRPFALRRRARRGRRRARGLACRDDSRGARQLPALLRIDRHPARRPPATSPSSTTGSAMRPRPTCSWV